MKIAYLLHWHNESESGVFKKVRMQIEAWQSLGQEVKLFLLTNSGSELAKQDLGHFSFSVEMAGYPSPMQRFKAAGRISRAILQWDPDVLYLRLSTGYYPAFSKLNSGAIIFEINSNERNELKNASLLRKIHNRISTFLWLKNATGLVFISGELSQLPHYKKLGKPSITIGNGINLDEYSVLPVTDNAKKTIVFIGSNTLLGKRIDWSGLDKIVELAKMFTDWEFHIIGFENIDESKQLNNIIYHSFLSRKDYECIMKRSTVGIGPLALYRKKMDEASPLKAREYLAFGLPVISAYKDTDFPDGAPFILQLPNSKHNVVSNKNQIQEFVENWHGKRVDHDQIAHLDSGIKEAERLNFIEKQLAK